MQDELRLRELDLAVHLHAPDGVVVVVVVELPHPRRRSGSDDGEDR